MAARKKKVFRDLFKYTVDKYIMQKGGKDFKAKYISWSDAWALLKLEVPDATKKTYECPKSGMPYFVSPDGCGVMVKVGVTVNDIEMICWQPIMDHGMRGKKLQQVTSRDIGDTEKRALVKAIAMHGLGLQLWSKLEKKLFDMDEVEAVDLEALSRQEPPDLDSISSTPAKVLDPQHASFNDNERKRFHGVLGRLNKDYEKVVEHLEEKGRPRPSQMDQDTRNKCIGWLEGLEPHFLAVGS
tara:strand:- start:637 stop:1359 length:723 start_codon:yes stop_codon:yes gene_type:complete